jgi:hypothetical protein
MALYNAMNSEIFAYSASKTLSAAGAYDETGVSGTASTSSTVSNRDLVVT